MASSTGGKLPHRWIISIGVATFLLLWPAILNGFPLIFPDTGAYLAVTWGHFWTFDRSGFYGLALKPLSSLPALTQLWLGLVVQAAAIAGVLILVIREMIPRSRVGNLLAIIAFLAVATSLPWHSAQLMPDAFTGISALLVWLAVLRDPTEPGMPLLWLAAVLAGLMHYTHLVLVPAVAIAALFGQAATGTRFRPVARRACAAAAATIAIFSGQIVANGLLLHRWSAAPAGPVFLFARLHEDGIVQPWLTRECKENGPVELCQVAAILPRDSQTFLWSPQSPIDRLVWKQFDSDPAQRLVAQMRQASLGGIGSQPLAVLNIGFRGTVDQFVHFSVLDDECPQVCGSPSSAVYDRLHLDRPELLPTFLGSAQLRGTLPKAFFRAITNPIAIFSMIALLVISVIPQTRRDSRSFSLALSVLIALVLNAALAGVLSDVHDRYQSRIVWLPTFAVLLIVSRWLKQKPAPVA